MRVTNWSAHESAVGTLAFSPDGQRMATGSTAGEVKIWDFPTRREATRLGPIGGAAICVAFSPEGRVVAASGWSDVIWVWELDTGRIIHLSGNDDPVFSIAFSPDGCLLASTTMAKNEVRLWELPSGRMLSSLRGHVAGVGSVAFSPDGKTLATGGTDRRVILWNVAAQQEIATLSPGSMLPMVDFSPDGRMLVVGDLAGGGSRIHVLRAPSFDEIAAAEAPDRRLDGLPRDSIHQ
jgi:WD40 repeat protein